MSTRRFLLHGETRWSFGVMLFIAAVALFTSGCATKGLLDANEPIQITSVKVNTPAPKPATVNLSEDLRYKTLKEAYRFSEAGKKMTLNVTIERLHIKNPVMAWLAGDNNHMIARAELIDGATGQRVGAFKATAVDSGYLQGVGGAIVAAIDNPVDVEQRLATGLASQLMEQVYGTEFARGVKNRVPSKKASPRYPAAYAQLKRDRECELKREMKKRQETSHEDVGQQTIRVPEYCRT